MGYDFGRIWIVGAYGHVGSTLSRMLDVREVELLKTDMDDVDITNAHDVAAFGEINRPDVIINCAGLSDPAECRDNVELAYKTNALGARNLSAVARRLDARMIQISTDDVFDGGQSEPFNEFDTPNPTTVYGKSKLAGEGFVRELAPRHVIIRSSWVYGVNGNNFVNSVLDKAKNQEVIEAAVDQFACPTSAIELSRLIIRLIRENQDGVYHAVCRGFCSRYELAKEILALIGRADIQVVPKKMEDLETIHDSKYAVLDNLMLRMCGIQEPAFWKEALAEYLAYRERYSEEEA